VRLFLEHGADVNGANDMGYTPLHYAALMGHLSVCEVLVEHGCNIAATDLYGDQAIPYICVLIIYVHSYYSYYCISYVYSYFYIFLCVCILLYYTCVLILLNVRCDFFFLASRRWTGRTLRSTRK
jgi:hypothetical protein